MRFDSVDPIIEPWGRLHSAPWQRLYRDEEVRSAELTLANGLQAQLWIEPQADGSIAVRAWDRRSHSHREIVGLSELSAALTRGLEKVRSWDVPANAV
jgi:hypothetical protein